MLVSTLALSALASAAFAHNDELSGHELAMHYRRQAKFTQCSSHLERRHAERMKGFGNKAFDAKRALLQERSLLSELGDDIGAEMEKLGLAAASLSQSAVSASSSGSAYAGCVLYDEQEEGPYYISGEEIRSNISESQEGVPFFFEFDLIDINTCDPLVGAAVDVWSCNSTGFYSGYAEESVVSSEVGDPNGNLVVGGQNDIGSTVDDTMTYLRGIQLTDTNGSVAFKGIIPGWYAGRAPHIHVRVHVNGTVLANGTYVSNTTQLVHTGQTFFGEDLYSQIANSTPYTGDTAARTLNDEDRPYTQQNGSEQVWNLYYVDGVNQDLSQGLIGYLTLALDPWLTSQTGVTGGAGGGNGTMPTGNFTGTGPAPTSTST